MLSRRNPYKRRVSRPINELTRREREAMTYAIRGKSNREMAKMLGVKVKTVKAFLVSIYEKNGVKTRAQLIVKAWDMEKVGQKLARRRHGNR